MKVAKVAHAASANSVTLHHRSRDGLSNEPAMINDECWHENAKLIMPTAMKHVPGRNVDCERRLMIPPAS